MIDKHPDSPLQPVSEWDEFYLDTVKTLAVTEFSPDIDLTRQILTERVSAEATQALARTVTELAIQRHISSKPCNSLAYEISEPSIPPLEELDLGLERFVFSLVTKSWQSGVGSTEGLLVAKTLASLKASHSGTSPIKLVELAVGISPLTPEIRRARVTLTFDSDLTDSKHLEEDRTILMASGSRHLMSTSFENRALSMMRDESDFGNAAKLFTKASKLAPHSSSAAFNGWFNSIFEGSTEVKSAAEDNLRRFASNLEVANGTKSRLYATGTSAILLACKNRHLPEGRAESAQRTLKMIFRENHDESSRR